MENLQLTPEQQAEIQQINEIEKQQLDALDKKNITSVKKAMDIAFKAKKDRELIIYKTTPVE